MRADTRILAFLTVLAISPAHAQSAADGPVLGARALNRSAGLKIWADGGQLKLVGWDRDSIVMRGRIARGDNPFFSGNSSGMKLGVEHQGSRESAGSSSIVIYLPRDSKISVKTVSASLDASDVSGWFYSVSGTIRLTGRASSLEVESMNGSLDLDVTTPWLRARTGDGHLLLRGAPQDVDASTISGTLDVVATTVLRGQFGSVSGDIHYVGTPAQGGIVEMSNHSGSVELLLPRSVSAEFALSSIIGPIENGFAEVRPIASAPHAVRLRLGRGGSQVSVRTFKGAIRLREQ
jgi:hypothetical protein